MAVKESAILEVLADVRDALKNLEKLKKEAIETFKKIERVAARVDTDKAKTEFKQLQDQMARTQREAIKVGEAAKKGLDRLGKEAKQSVPPIKGVRRELAGVERRLAAMRVAAAQFGKGVAAGAAVAQKALVSLRATLTSIAGAFALIGGALVFRKIIENTKRQAKAEAVLNQVIKATGEAADLTGEQLKAMASGLQEVTTFGDEAVIEAQKILLTFKEIGAEVFPRVLESTLDLAVVLGREEGLADSAIQLGKALNDPIANLSALSRAGIQFTEAQKETIKTLVESGQKLEAQKIILGELESQFGGTARAARDRFGGEMEALGNRVGDVLELIGEAGLLGALDDVSRELSEFSAEGGAISGFEKIGQSLGNMVKIFAILFKGGAAFISLIKGGFALINGVIADLLLKLAKIGENFKFLPGPAGEAFAKMEQQAADLAAGFKRRFEEIGRSAEEGLRRANAGIKQDLIDIGKISTGEYGRLKKAQDDAAQSARELQEEEKGVADAVLEATNSLAGNIPALEQQTDTLLAAIEALKAGGRVTKEVAANIGAEIGSLLAEFAAFGIAAPESIRAAAIEFPDLEAAAKAAAEGIGEVGDASKQTAEELQAMADQAAAAEAALESLNRAQAQRSEAAKNVQELEDELTSLRDTSVLTLEQTERQTELITLLNNARNKERDATQDVTQAQLDYTNAAEDAAAAAADLADVAERQADAMRSAADVVADVVDELGQVGDAGREAAAGLQEIGKGVSLDEFKDKAEDLEEVVESLDDKFDEFGPDAAESVGQVNAAMLTLKSTAAATLAVCEKLNACLRETGQ